MQRRPARPSLTHPHTCITDLSRPPLARLLQLVLVLAGLLGLCLLPLLERRIEFDENALLAGSARPTIR